MPIDGLQELINAVEKISDERTVTQLQKKALKPVAKEVLNDMQTIAPKSPRHSVHGADIMEMVTFSKRGRKGYEIGLTNQGLSDKWSISRGLWFQEYKTDEPNYQWFTKWIKSEKQSYVEKAKEEAKESLKQYLSEYL